MTARTYVFSPVSATVSMQSAAGSGHPRRTVQRGGGRFATTPPSALQHIGSVQAEALVGLAVAVVDLHLLAVGGAPDVQAAAGLAVADGAVAVDVPLLVGLSVAVGDLHRRAVAG